MAKSEQVLILEPPTELHFKGSFTSIVTSILKLNNPTEQRVCFKVKTTAPRQYCVRPNSGIIEPKQAVQVAVMLQPFEYNPNEKNKHKFMVQTMFAPDGDFNQDALWRDATPDSLMDSKLRCVFEALPDSTTNGQSNADAVNSLNALEASKTELQTAAKASPKVSNTERRKVTENEVPKVDTSLQDSEGKEVRQRLRPSESGQSGVGSRISRPGDEASSQSRATFKPQPPQPSHASGVSSAHEETGLLQNPFQMALLLLVCVLGVLIGKFLL